MADTTALVPYGISRQSYALRVRWARGDFTVTDNQRRAASRLAHQILARRRARFAVTCGKGHRWTDENTYWGVRRTGKQAGQLVRVCIACQLIQKGRRQQARRRVAADDWRGRLRLAHPDTGGTHEAVLRVLSERQQRVSTVRPETAFVLRMLSVNDAPRSTTDLSRAWQLELASQGTVVRERDTRCVMRRILHQLVRQGRVRETRTFSRGSIRLSLWELTNNSERSVA